MRKQLPTFPNVLILGQCAPFRQIDADRLGQLSEFLEVAEYDAGEFLTRTGQPAKEMFFILRGKVQVFYHEKVDENEELEFEVSEAGDFLGEVGMLTGTRSASARALETTQVLVLDIKDWTKFIQKYPEVISAMMQTSAERMARMTATLRETPQDIINRLEKQRPPLEKMMAGVVGTLCTIPFFLVNVIAGAAYLIWCLWNGFKFSGSWYAALGLILSIEATLISLMVLVKQRGDEAMSDIRFAKLYHRVQLIQKKLEEPAAQNKETLPQGQQAVVGESEMTSPPTPLLDSRLKAT